MVHIKHLWWTRAATLLGLLAIVALLAACAVPAGQVPAAGETEAGTTAGEEAAPGEAITLRIMHWDTQMVEETDYWNVILRGFEEQHPGVTVENNFVPFGQYLTTLEAMAAGEELPDVFWGHV